MDVIKKKIDGVIRELILINEIGDKFTMHYAGQDFYWTMFDYHAGNEFIISKDDEIIFSEMEKLFNVIIKKDNPYSSLLKDSCFEWISESYGVPEESNKLTIKKTDNKYIINFFQSPKKAFFRKDICSVCFCLSGSRNREISTAFSIMFHDYIQDGKNKQKVLK